MGKYLTGVSEHGPSSVLHEALIIYGHKAEFSTHPRFDRCAKLSHKMQARLCIKAGADWRSIDAGKSCVERFNSDNIAELKKHGALEILH